MFFLSHFTLKINRKSEGKKEKKFVRKLQKERPSKIQEEKRIGKKDKLDWTGLREGRGVLKDPGFIKI